MQPYFVRFIFALFIVIALPAVAGDATDQLISFLSPIKTLHGDFSQESRDAHHVIRNKQNGQFKVKNSGEFIWEVSTPYEQKIVYDGKFIRMYDPDLQQVTIKTIDANTQVVPLLLFSKTSEEIKSLYVVTANNSDSFELTPRSKSSLFEKITISFSDGKPTSLSIFDSMKQETTVHFKNIKINEVMDASFELKLPADVDVIDERQ